ncbi:MAG TPA: glycoside hydrolase family 2 TIM barrel-domain containing protein [Pyrinomonadaceae bacterium]
MKTIKLFMLVLLCGFTNVLSNAQVSNTNTEIRFLSGIGKDDAVWWDFFCTEGRKSGVWTRIRVPSNWETEGFGNSQYGGDRQREANPFPKEQGKYRLTFDVPQRWKSRVVRLVFDGSMTDTEVWVNGKSAGPVHQGSFYQFKFDITTLLNFAGPNLLEVTVSKESSNVSVNRAERLGDYWNFGGIFRPVYLEALPDRFIDETAIDARADGGFSVEVNLGGSDTSPGRLSGQIIDSKGIAVGQPFGAGLSVNQNKVKLQTRIRGPRLWTAETPNLYRVRLTLTSNSGSPHTVTKRFGFRTFEVKPGDGFYLNGQRILLKGVNRHSFWPETGRTLSRQISYDDIKLIKEMNMNAVRMSHYPPDQHFLDACDELGLYVIDELGGWQKFYDGPTGARLIRQLVRRDVNHPSIVLWANGNEGGWNRDNDDEFARWDPQQREVLHPWEKFRHVNTDHYEKFDSHTKLANGPDIYMPTEMLHGLYDGGIGAGLSDYWEVIRKSKVGGGAFLWALVDECVKRTDQNGRLDCAGNRGPDGIVGPHREREGSFNTVREIWSPIQVLAPEKLPDDFQGRLAVENRYDFTNLNECRFEWQLARFPLPAEGSSGHRVVASGSMRGPDIAPHASGELKLTLPRDWRGANVLYVTAKDADGRELWTWSWGLKTSATRAGKYRAVENLRMVETAEELSIETRRFCLVFSKRSGRISEGGPCKVLLPADNMPISSGPHFFAFRRNNRKYDDISGQSTVTKFAFRKEGSEAVIEFNYSGALHSTRWRVAADIPSAMKVRLEYEYTFAGAVDMIGVGFNASENMIKKVRWLGMGPYRVWQNRLQGTRLDVWQTAYNESTPGANWTYPESQGYFRDWRWVLFETAVGPFSITSQTSGSFLGLFKPRDGVDGLLEFPDIGIAFLEVIPAMRNKFHTTDEIGPQSKPLPVSGLVKRTVLLRFGR